MVGDNPHLKTPTSILVKIKLVHPTACLKVYDFISDASLANTIVSTEVNVNNKGKVTSTNLYGSLSHNVLVVNTCGTRESFDLRVYLDSWFSTHWGIQRIQRQPDHGRIVVHGHSRANRHPESRVGAAFVLD